MRLFGKTDSTLDRFDRAALLTIPFDIALTTTSAVFAGQVYTPGAKVGQVYSAGALAGQVFTPGAEIGQADLVGQIGD